MNKKKSYLLPNSITMIHVCHVNEILVEFCTFVMIWDVFLVSYLIYQA